MLSSMARFATRATRTSRGMRRAFGSSTPSVGSGSSSPVAAENPAFDSEVYDHYQSDAMESIAQGEPNKRGFTYLMLGGARVAIATTGRVALLKLLDSMNASADVLALASLEVDIDNIPVGENITVKWRGKPVFIRRRTPEEIKEASEADLGSMRDPEADEDRVKNPEWLVVLGICTHLGCVPINGAGDYNGYFCPCHGSHYDTSGRIRKGPAPLNLEVPPYKFDDESGKLIVG